MKKETGVAKTTVGDNLDGKVKATRTFFRKCDKGHGLSEEGLQWISNEVIPSMSDSLDDTENEDA